MFIIAFVVSGAFPFMRERPMTHACRSDHAHPLTDPTIGLRFHEEEAASGSKGCKRPGLMSPAASASLLAHSAKESAREPASSMGNGSDYAEEGETRFGTVRTGQAPSCMRMRCGMRR